MKGMGDLLDILLYMLRLYGGLQKLCYTIFYLLQGAKNILKYTNYI